MSILPITREQIAACLDQLPPMKQATLDALEALRNEELGSADCAELLGHDPALAARALRLANSAFYGVPGRVMHLRDAVHLLGRRTLASLVTVALLARQFDTGPNPALSVTAFWRHAIASGYAARELAQALETDAELAFLTGLLHDVGRLALAAHFPEAMDTVMQRAQDPRADWLRIEREVFGTDHVAVGREVALRWRFPQTVADAIAAHHAPVAGPGGGASLSDIVHTADAIAHALDLNGDPWECVPPLDPASWDRLGLPPRVLLPALRVTERGVAELSLALGVAPAPVPELMA